MLLLFGMFFVVLGLVESVEQAELRHLRGLYLGWLHFHNAGDDLLFDVATVLFSEAGLKKNSRGTNFAISLSPHLPPNPCRSMLIGLEAFDFVVLGGGTLLRDNRYTCTLWQARNLNKPIFLFGTGFGGPRETASWLQGVAASYDPEFGLVQGSWNKRTAAIGLPLWPMDRTTLGAIVSGPAAGGVRGPLSLSLSDEVSGGKASETLAVLGDAGILVRLTLVDMAAPKLRTAFLGGVLGLAEEARAAGRRVIAVNYGTNIQPGDNALTSVFHKNTSQIALAFQSLVCELGASNNFEVIMFAMEPKDLDPLFSIYGGAKVFNEGICWTAQQNGHVHALEAVLDASATAMLLGVSDLAVCYKLHGAIVAAAMGTPFLGVACTLRPAITARSFPKRVCVFQKLYC